jgi:galactose oxidase-like protein
MTARASVSSYSPAIPADRRSPTRGIGTALSGRRSPTLDHRPGRAWRWPSTRQFPRGLVRWRVRLHLFADTWTWDGTEWTQVADTGPAARSGHALVYDDVRKRAVLFGGRGAANPLGDTWEWDGTEWTQVQDVGPSARRAHAMAFDPTASRVVLFGGAGTNGAGLNDTWLWDGTDWTQAADTGPDPRAQSAMVAAATIVLFGGVNSIDPTQANRIRYGDSWRWDGHAWTKAQDIGPAPRWGHGMAFQSDIGQIVLFGGSSVFGPAEDGSLQAGVMRDTWEHPEAADDTGGGGGWDGRRGEIGCGH